MTTTTGQVQLIALAQLVPSKTNPRTAMDETGLKELAQSIAENGILLPLLARPLKNGNGNGNGHKKKYEVIAGERRYRAAQLAKLEEVPVIVRELTDVEAISMQLVENLQRKDISPLDEARGFAAALALRDDKKAAVFDVPGLAKKVGKTQSAIYQSIKLLDLIEPAQALMASDTISAGHGVLIARLEPKSQKAAVDWLKEWTERSKHSHNTSSPSVRDLKRFIFEEIVRSLDKAPFSPKAPDYKTPDAQDLNAAAEKETLPACTVCPYRASTNPELHADLDEKTRGNTCNNPPCYEMKITLHLKRKQVELQDKHPEAVTITRHTSGNIKHMRTQAEQKRLAGVVTADRYVEVKQNAKGAVPALVVDGHDRGSMTYIAPSVSEQLRDERRQQGPDPKTMARNLSLDIERETNIAVLHALSERVKFDDYLMKEMAVFAVDHGLDRNERKKFFGERFENVYRRDQVEKAIEAIVADKTAQKVKPERRLLVALVGGLFGRTALGHWSDGIKHMKDVAAHYGVDVAKIAAGVKKEPKFQQRQHRIKTITQNKEAKKRKPSAHAKRQARINKAATAKAKVVKMRPKKKADVKGSTAPAQASASADRRRAARKK